MVEFNLKADIRKEKNTKEAKDITYMYNFINDKEGMSFSLKSSKDLKLKAGHVIELDLSSKQTNIAK